MAKDNTADLVKLVVHAEQVAKREVVYVGIDPGADGAVGVVVGNKAAAVSVPTIKVKRKGGTKTAFNNPEIVRLFSYLKPVKDRIRVCLEQAQVQIKGKGANAYTAYRVGVSYGMWPLFLASKGYYVEEVVPTVWKKAMGLAGKDKEAARLKACGLFPHAGLSLKKDHNRAEALLLADYLRRRSNER